MATMESIKHFKRLFEYNHWANRESGRIAATLRNEQTRAFKIMSHIVGAEQLWLDRLHGDPQSTAVWPEIDLQTLPDQLDRLHANWARFIDNQREEKLLRPISYANSRGEPWANRVEEILTHVVIHSAYHRGQLALLIRDAGSDPPLTDFVHAVRTGMIE